MIIQPFQTYSWLLPTKKDLDDARKKYRDKAQNYITAKSSPLESLHDIFSSYTIPADFIDSDPECEKESYIKANRRQGNEQRYYKSTVLNTMNENLSTANPTANINRIHHSGKESLKHSKESYPRVSSKSIRNSTNTTKQTQNDEVSMLKKMKNIQEYIDDDNTYDCIDDSDTEDIVINKNEKLSPIKFNCDILYTKDSNIYKNTDIDVTLGEYGSPNSKYPKYCMHRDTNILKSSIYDENKNKNKEKYITKNTLNKYYKILSLPIPMCLEITVDTLMRKKIFSTLLNKENILYRKIQNNKYNLLPVPSYETDTYIQKYKDILENIVEKDKVLQWDVETATLLVKGDDFDIKEDNDIYTTQHIQPIPSLNTNRIPPQTKPSILRLTEFIIKEVQDRKLHQQKKQYMDCINTPTE